MKTVLLALGFMVLMGCTQTPTQSTQTVDDRPGIAFNVQSASAREYELTVDGVSYGAVGQYLEGENLLRLVDGTHVIKLFSDGEVIFKKKVYLGAGVDRVIEVGSID